MGVKMSESARPVKRCKIQSTCCHYNTKMILQGPPISSLATRTFRERVPLDRLRCIFTHYEKIKPCIEGPEQPLPRDGDDTAYNPCELLNKLLLKCEDQHDGTCLIPVNYKESRLRRNWNLPGGRLYAEHGLQGICKWIRHTLCGDLYHDIDIVNAHPTLLLQLMERLEYGSQFPILHKVVHYREELFDEARQAGFQRDAVKIFILKLMFGGESLPESAWTSLSWLRTLQKEFEDAAAIIVKLPDCQEKLEMLRSEENMGENRGHADNGTDYLLHQRKFRLLSCILQEIENTILHSCISYIVNQGRSIDEVVLCFDGFMVPKTEIREVGQGFLNSLSEWIKECTDWEVKFSVKPMNMVVDLSGLKPEFVPGRSIESDVDACTIIREMAGGEIAYRAEGQLYTKSHSTSKWQIGRDNFAEIMKQYCRKADLRLNGKKYSHNALGMRNIMSVYEPKEDPNFPHRLAASCKGKIFWENGVYDFRAGRFRPLEHGDMTAVSVPRKYPKQVPPKERIDYIEKTLFWDTLGEEEGKAFLTILARALAGHIEDKRWFVILGDRNSGKGVIEKALRSALGPEYVSTFNIKAFREKSQSNDAEYKLKWLYGLRWSRLSFSNESVSRDMKLDADLIKQVVSGGDPIRLRLPHGMPFSITPQCTFLNNANEVSNVSSTDALETRVVFHCKGKYVEKSVYYSKTDEERPSSWMLADPDLKQRLDTEEMKDIIWYLLLRYYSSELPVLPESLQTEMDMNRKEDGNDIDSVINDIFEITGLESDFSKSSDIESAWKLYGKGFSLSKMRSKLKQLHAPGKGCHVQSTSKYIKGGDISDSLKKCRGWTGIKLKSVIQEDLL